jgi:hypothetical protein
MNGAAGIADAAAGAAVRVTDELAAATGASAGPATAAAGDTEMPGIRAMMRHTTVPMSRLAALPFNL